MDPYHEYKYEVLEPPENLQTPQEALFSSIEDALAYLQPGSSNQPEVKNNSMDVSEIGLKEEPEDDPESKISIFNEEKKMETIFSSRGRPKLVLDGAMYTLFRANKDGTVSWRCEYYRKHDCKVRVFTSGNELVELKGLHNHAVDPTRVVAQKLRNTAKLTAMIAPDERTGSIADRSLEQVSPFLGASKAKRTSLNRLISRYKKSSNVKTFAQTSMDSQFPMPSELSYNIQPTASGLEQSLNAILPEELQGKAPTSNSLVENLAKLASIKPIMASKNAKLLQLRTLFRKYDINAYYMPRTDAHQSEYIQERDERVCFISGFSGSNGNVIVTEEKALLWTDGRYFIQADKELEESWQLMKEGTPDSTPPLDWLVENMPLNSTVGIDPRLFGYSKGVELVEALDRVSIKTKSIGQNLIDELWKDRPQEACVKAIALKPEEHGEESTKKVERVREKLAKKKCDTIVLTMLDDIAWLLNIRGFDIPHNPVLFSYVVITPTDVHLFVNDQKLSPELYEHLKHIKIHPYDSIGYWLAEYHTNAQKNPTHKVYIPDTANYFIGSLISKNHSVVGPSPVQTMKAVKNDVELAGMRNCHIRDSAAHVQFLVWLKKELDAGHTVTELQASDKIAEFRKAQPNFVELSFPTIPGAGDHAALPHYHATEESGQRVITKDTVFLIDSGGQYRDGTTDVTRTTFHGASPGEYFKQMFTLVLKGHIDNAMMTFPDGISGIRLDTLARAPLWAEGYDFGHGTGHGVGHFLNVHEGPISIGFRAGINPEGGLHAGQVITIEPGYYEQGLWGIRIENCYEIVKAPPLASGVENFLTFSPLTLVPIQRNLIKQELLSGKHIDWLNNYHKKVLHSVGPYLKKGGHIEEYDYLVEACQPL